MAYLPYWGYIENDQGTENYKKYYYRDLSTLFIITTVSRDSVLSNQGLIFGDQATHSSNQVNFAAMIRYIRNNNPGLKIILSLSDLHNTPEERSATAELLNGNNRETTIRWLMQNYIDLYDLDGLDIDFEDETLENRYVGLHYADFIRELAEALHDRGTRGRRKLCTATLAGPDYNRPIITPELINSLDMLGIQTYSADKMDYLRYNRYRNIKADYENWTAKGFPANKLAFGLAMWSKIADPARPMGLQLPDSGTSDGLGWIEQLKQDASSNYRAYLTSSFNTPGYPGSYEQRYNGLYEIRRRAEWVREKGARGLRLGTEQGPFSRRS